MKDKFEKYLESQRQQLDVEHPDDVLIWDGVRKELGKPKRRFSNLFWKAAAILIFLASSTYVFYNEVYRADANIYKITLSEIDPAYSQQVINYCSLIDEKWAQVNELTPDEMAALNIFIEELEDLDKMHREYQKDYHSYGYNQGLIKAMLDYYEKRIRILDRMLMETQKQKDYEKRKEAHVEI
jgi:hypothetical protein